MLADTMGSDTGTEELLAAIELRAREKIDTAAQELEHQLTLAEAELRYGA